MTPMRRPTDATGPGRPAPTRRTSGTIAAPVLATLALAVVLTLSGCSAVLRVGEDAPSRDADRTTASVRVSVDDAGAIGVVRIPETRPAEGVRVSPGDGRPTFRVPPGHYPPPGACRIWDPAVPPGLQPPPGACDELERQVPPGSYLIVG